MAILYALVARGTVVLAEFSAVTGNTGAVARRILDKLPEEADSRLCLSQDRYIFHILRSDGLTFLCMANDTFGRRVPFSYLEDIHMRFMKNYGKVAHYAPAYAMNDEFSRVLHQQMEFFSSSPSADTLNRVRGEIRTIMVENIEKILERGDRIELLVDKTATMQDVFVSEIEPCFSPDSVWEDSFVSETAVASPLPTEGDFDGVSPVKSSELAVCAGTFSRVNYDSTNIKEVQLENRESIDGTHTGGGLCGLGEGEQVGSEVELCDVIDDNVHGHKLSICANPTVCYGASTIGQRSGYLNILEGASGIHVASGLDVCDSRVDNVHSQVEQHTFLNVSGRRLSSNRNGGLRQSKFLFNSKRFSETKKVDLVSGAAVQEHVYQSGGNFQALESVSGVHEKVLVHNKRGAEEDSRKRCEPARASEEYTFHSPMLDGRVSMLDGRQKQRVVEERNAIFSSLRNLSEICGSKKVASLKSKHESSEEG
ncbi:VAMP714 protein [Hibiscus syriacus]|uniref:VAMP714 protein n=1 Tax=Hibiscus syriacus TaxID=106335 RepID=A0A6A3BZD6_HIBSY|nr:VAMP714 protein [Hibiscus syriacus]